MVMRLRLGLGAPAAVVDIALPLPLPLTAAAAVVERIAAAPLAPLERCPHRLAEWSGARLGEG